MSVRVVARLRPLWKTEKDLDVIVHTASSSHSIGKEKPDANPALTDRDNIVKIPNPKNEGEQYAFQFNAVYDGNASQQEIFDAEVAPTVKHLFNGFDVTIFAYGVTGTGKTHTMRGGKSLADRGVIPRLLSSIYRRSRKIEKDSAEGTKVEVSMSYYEIYNDKVYDLFEPPEKRTLAGLPLRDNGGKTIVVGLTERPCRSLKDFEVLYDQANVNRSTSATKLNAHSSRSHAILCVKVTLITGDKVRTSVASAIDLAGSEDNRRTENGKERMVESASINKSLFVLAQCVEAISKKQSRVPYRESKMTRILSLGQNNGLTIMILNLAPVRSYHLDTISSLNFANRTKKIEVRDVENEPIFRGPNKPAPRPLVGSSMNRQPLRPLTSSVNIAVTVAEPAKSDEKKPAKAFLVYSDKVPTKNQTVQRKSDIPKRLSPLKRTSDVAGNLARPVKTKRIAEDTKIRSEHDDHISAAKIEELVEKKVEAILAARASLESTKQNSQIHVINEQMQRRIEELEKRIEGTEDARAEGLSFLLMAKQYHARGEDISALKMYKLALPFFPHNEKLLSKISKLESKLASKSHLAENKENMTASEAHETTAAQEDVQPLIAKHIISGTENDYQNSGSDDYCSDSSVKTSKSKRNRRRRKSGGLRGVQAKAEVQAAGPEPLSPRTSHLLGVINSRDISQIKLLKGVGAKKAEAIVDCLCELDNHVDTLDQTLNGTHSDRAVVTSLIELERLKGVGSRTVQNMRNGLMT